MTPELAESSPRQAELIDAAVLLPACGGNEELLRVMADLFTRHVGGHLHRLQAAIAAGDAADVALTCHRLRGLASAFSKQTAAQIAELESTELGSDAMDKFAQIATNISRIIAVLPGLTCEDLRRAVAY